MIEAGCKCSETGLIKCRDTEKQIYTNRHELELGIDEETTFGMKKSTKYKEMRLGMEQELEYTLEKTK